MSFINWIKIKNFRSLTSVTIKDLSNLNIVIGNNDTGKSNVLKALNLFFNNETESRVQFDFEKDYSYKAQTGQGKAKEITIEIELLPSEQRFKNSKSIIWKKVWRKEGLYTSKSYLKYSDGTEIEKMNKIIQWANKLIFRYVPANKEEKYFQVLMGELHDVLNKVYEEEFNKHGKTFVSEIIKITETISDDLEKMLKIRNTIQPPQNYKNFFEGLDFGIPDSENIYYLLRRGDGIKVRHIPVILKYMAEQEKVLSKRGYVNPDTIWGIEEPENNMEMSIAFDMARNIYEYSKGIQVFISTHSPSFYSLADEKDVGTYFITKEDNISKCEKIGVHHKKYLDEKMGILPIITPYIKEKADENMQLRIKLESIANKGIIKDETKYIIFTEDSKIDMLKILLKANGANENEFIIETYSSSSNLEHAIYLAHFLQNKYPKVKIFLHRDSDYLSEDEKAKYKNKIKNHNILLFFPKGTDIESIFINVKHIKHIYNELLVEEIENFIDEATKESKEDSFDKFYSWKAKNNIDDAKEGRAASLYKEVKKEFEENIEKYRFGKKVLGLLTSKLQKRIKRNPVLIVETPEIIIEEIRKFFS